MLICYEIAFNLNSSKHRTSMICQITCIGDRGSANLFNILFVLLPVFTLEFKSYSPMFCFNNFAFLRDIEIKMNPCIHAYSSYSPCYV